jgi:4-hydroxymandelate synthase
MAARDIEYIELYTNDKASIVNYFRLSLGFTQVAESSGHGMDSALLRQGSVQIVVTAGPSTREFLDAHGDGVADIALTCDDVTATRGAVGAAGAWTADSPWGGSVVSGFGGVRHTLLPVARSGTPRLPAGRTWAGMPRAPARPAERIRVLDHVAVCLESGTLADYADIYRDAFGLARYSSEYIEVGDQAMDSIVVRSLSGGITFTLLEQDSTRSTGQVDAFLDRNSGPGVQHLAFEVDDMIPSVREFRDRGIEFLSTPGKYYDMLMQRFADLRVEIADLRDTHVLADRDEWGYLLQLFTRSPYERNTLFYELIQRRGARGFGGANIRALYEAVERDRMTAR